MKKEMKPTTFRKILTNSEGTKIRYLKGGYSMNVHYVDAKNVSLE